MEAQDILKMLTNLEQSLQNVESARQQVTNTVNAYEGTKAQLHALTVEFKEVSSELNKVYNAIKENVDSIDETLKIKIDSVFKSISKKVDTLDAVAEKNPGVIHCHDGPHPLGVDHGVGEQGCEVNPAAVEHLPILDGDAGHREGVSPVGQGQAGENELGGGGADVDADR